MSNCLICSSDKTKKIRPFKGANQIFDNKFLMQCMNCQMVYLSPMPSDADLEIYNANYFESAHGGHPSNPSALAFFSGIGKLRGYYVDSFLLRNGLNAKRVLEIGPGHGYFAKNWIELHPNVDYFGVETDKSCYESLKRAGVKILAPEQVDSSFEEVDLVIISHVLEHVSNPESFLQTVTKKLRKGGVLFIEVPCFDWQHKELDEPHLLFFDKEPLKLLLKKVGFDQIEVNYYGNTIELLKSRSKIDQLFTKIRSKLIDMGFHGIFAYPAKKGLSLLTPLERAASSHAMAHRESAKPAWWLRTVSIKQ
jgi:SAM-dependent methyltransferase